MSKELVDLSELYSQIITEDKDAEDAKKERELEATLKNLKNKKQEDNRPRITVGGKTYYKGDPGYDAAMKKSGPDEVSSPQEVIQKDKDTKALEAGAVERKDTDADPVDGPKMSTADRIAMAKANAKKVSPASIKTNQRQTRDIIKQQSKSAYPTLDKGDLNQFNRTKKYTADDGKTQVDRSTVFTKAAMDFGNIKKGQALGVLTRSQRSKYDVAASKLKNSSATSSNVKINPTLDNDVKEGYGDKDKKKKKKKKMYEGIDAYDSVLNYLIGTNQAQSVEEANHIMMEMDGKTIMEIKKIINESEINRADIRGGSKAVEYARQGKGNYKPGAGVTKDFQLDPNFKIKA